MKIGHEQGIHASIIFSITKWRNSKSHLFEWCLMRKEFDYSFIEHAYTASKPAWIYWSILSIDVRNQSGDTSWPFIEHLSFWQLNGKIWETLVFPQPYFHKFSFDNNSKSLTKPAISNFCKNMQTLVHIEHWYQKLMS